MLDTNLIQFKVSGFNLVLLWSFLGLPSHHTGDSIHLETTKYHDGLSVEQIEWMREIEEGLDELQAAAMWDEYRAMATQNYYDLLLRSEKLDRTVMEFLEWARFLAIGHSTSRSRKLIHNFRRRITTLIPPS